jgi:hypothetical protein
MRTVHHRHERPHRTFEAPPIVSRSSSSGSSSCSSSKSCPPSHSSSGRMSAHATPLLHGPATPRRGGSAAAEPAASTPLKTPSSSRQTKKAMRISSGNRFYANLVSNRQKEEERHRRQRALVEAMEIERALKERNACFERVPSSSGMIRRTQSAEMQAAFFHLSVVSTPSLVA